MDNELLVVEFHPFQFTEKYHRLLSGFFLRFQSDLLLQFLLLNDCDFVLLDSELGPLYFLEKLFSCLLLVQVLIYGLVEVMELSLEDVFESENVSLAGPSSLRLLSENFVDQKLIFSLWLVIYRVDSIIPDVFVIYPGIYGDFGVYGELPGCHHLGATRKIIHS